MLAAKAGAKQVYTIEANPDYARLATEIVELKVHELFRHLACIVVVREALAEVEGEAAPAREHAHLTACSWSLVACSL